MPALAILLIANEAVAQCQAHPDPNFQWPDPLKGTIVADIEPNIGNGYYNGLIQWLPTDYNTAPEKEYPVIIFFHGASSYGTGSALDLCKIIRDLSQLPTGGRPTHLVNHIERGTWGTDVVPTVGATSFIVIAPQAASYLSPFNYADQTDALIDYVVNNYRVDESRIYLTGLSFGAGHAVDYISSSLEHAERVAAVGIAASCFKLEFAPANGPANIANSGVATWFTLCALDGDAFCGLPNHDNWVNAINAESPLISPRVDVWATENTGGQPFPQSLNYCQGFHHDSWSALYSPDFMPSDAGPSFYSWLLTHQSGSTLPVVLKSFTARLSNGKVYLRWVTSSEQENNGFTIERAGANGSFTAITQVGGGGTTSGDRIYEYVDESPLTNLSFYRLKQQDLNGRFKLFEPRKVMNKSRYKSMILITPNPFTSDPSAFVTIDKRQRVSVWLSDMSGRILSTVNGVYEEGTTELSLPMGNLPRGIYFVKVKGENITETHKIIKQ